METLKETFKQKEEELINEYLDVDGTQQRINIIHNDDELKKSDIDSMMDHNELFSSLLRTYVNNSVKNLKSKVTFKKVFFWVCIGILAVVCIGFFVIMFYAIKTEAKTEVICTVVASTVISFISSFMVLPKTIADYLFNTDEEKYMTEIVKSIQEHDKEIRKGIK